MSAVEEGAAKVSDSRRHRLSGSQLGSLIAAVFGLIYLEANSGSLPAPLPAALRIAAAVAFVGLLALLLGRRRPHATTGQPGGSGFGAEYWSVVAGEVAAIVAGSIILTTVFDLPHGVVAWVSVVVGVHFIVLAAIWRLSLLRILGIAIALCGLAGVTAAAAGAATVVIAATGGIAPGALLLASAYWGAVDSDKRPGRDEAYPAGSSK